MSHGALWTCGPRMGRLKRGMPAKPVLLGRPTRANALYFFADIRGFTPWARDNQQDIDRLLTVVYTLAVDIFGAMSGLLPRKRVVKFLGDGFFAVNEYTQDDHDSLAGKLLETLNEISYFNLALRHSLHSSTLHGKSKIAMGFGLSHGTSRRFTLSNFPTDYAGDRVNLAARLCSLAEGGTTNCEEDLVQYLMDLRKDNKLIIQEPEATEEEIKGFGTVKFVNLRKISTTLPAAAHVRQIGELAVRYGDLAKALVKNIDPNPRSHQ